MKKTFAHYVCLALIFGCALVVFMQLGRDVAACGTAGVLGLGATYVLIRVEERR